MLLPKDSFRARILPRKALGWLYFAHRALTCKQARIGIDCPRRGDISQRKIWQFGSRFLCFRATALVAAQ
jgi:hypothetical protein